MHHHYIGYTTAELCSQKIRMLGRQRLINSLQIGPKVFEIHPKLPPLSPSLHLSVSLFLHCSVH